MSLIKNMYMSICGLLLKPWMNRDRNMSRIESKQGMNERPIEYGFALDCIAKTSPTSVLDVGSGHSSWPSLLYGCRLDVDAIDKIEGYWASLHNRHYPISKGDITQAPNDGKRYDIITCISVLEHIPDYKAAIRGMLARLRDGGHIVITVPFNNERFYEDVYKEEEAGYGKDVDYICQVYTPDTLFKAVENHGGEILESRFYNVFEGGVWTFGNRIYPPRIVSKEKADLACLLIKKK